MVSRKISLFGKMQRGRSPSFELFQLDMYASPSSLQSAHKKFLFPHLSLSSSPLPPPAPSSPSSLFFPLPPPLLPLPLTLSAPSNMVQNIWQRLKFSEICIGQGHGQGHWVKHFWYDWKGLIARKWYLISYLKVINYDVYTFFVLFRVFTVHTCERYKCVRVISRNPVTRIGWQSRQNSLRM